MISKPASSQKVQLTIIVLVYLVFASIFGFAYRFAINPDGLSHLRLAGYIAEGNFQQSISASWSPLTSWLMSPFLYFGFDGLTTARIIIALCGAGLVIGSWFLALRFKLTQNSRFIAVLIAALLISDWSIRNIGADILIAALLSLYFYVVMSPDILRRKKIAFLAGIIGGIAYLAKNYTFPFFMVHFPLTLLIRYYFDKNEKGDVKRNLLVPLIVGITGFIIISSVWIFMLSAKYGQFTITGKGKIVRSLTAPLDIRQPPMFKNGLHKPGNNYAIHIFEDHSIIKYRPWSPFESKEHFIYQLDLIKENIVYIFNHFIKKSPFFIYASVVGVLTLMLTAFLLNPLNAYKKVLYTWIIMTFVTYCSGYILLIARSPRRFYVLMIIFLFLSVHFLEELSNGVKDIISGRRKKLLTLYVLLIIISAFTIKPGIHLLKSLKDAITVDQVNQYKIVAEQTNTIEFPVPYAVIRSAQKAYTDYYIAYYLKKQFLGRPLSSDIDSIYAELKSVGAKSLLVFDSPSIVERLIEDERYVHTATINLKSDKRYLNAVNNRLDVITGWDKEVNIFLLK